jgi:hypothetical protein
MNSGILSKLPRPTRFLPPCGGRSLLEGGALPHRQCAPRPHAWTRPGFLLPSLPSAWVHCLMLPTPTEGRDCPADLIPGVLTLKPKMGRELNPFAVVVPECRTRYSRATGASLLMAPTVSDLCQGSSGLLYEFGGNKPSHTGFLSSRLTSFGEEGGATLPRAECRRSAPFLKE